MNMWTWLNLFWMGYNERLLWRAWWTLLLAGTTYWIISLPLCPGKQYSRCARYKSVWKNGNITPLILNLSTRWRSEWSASHSGRFTPAEVLLCLFNPLTPNNHNIGCTAPLTSKRCILYIYSTNIGIEYFKHSIYSPCFSLQNAVCFIILTYLVPVLITFYIQRECAKIKKK